MLKNKSFFKRWSIFFIISFLTILIFTNTSVQAQGTGSIFPIKSSVKSNCKGLSAEQCGDYGVNDFLSLAIKIAQLILGIVGSLTLIMFIIGGVNFIISAGSSEKITQAKKIIVAAVVGLIIVFSSWLIINFLISTISDEKYNLDNIESLTNKIYFPKDSNRL